MCQGRLAPAVTLITGMQGPGGKEGPQSGARLVHSWSWDMDSLTASGGSCSAADLLSLWRYILNLWPPGLQVKTLRGFRSLNLQSFGAVATGKRSLSTGRGREFADRIKGADQPASHIWKSMSLTILRTTRENSCADLKRRKSISKSHIQSW